MFTANLQFIYGLFTVYLRFIYGAYFPRTALGFSTLGEAETVPKAKSARGAGAKTVPISASGGVADGVNRRRKQVQKLPARDFRGSKIFKQVYHFLN